jgi:hypothetical protein
MKKLFCIFLLIFGAFFVHVQFAKAQNDQELKLASLPLGISEEKIDYQLPYPGLLPDNPFYPLKVLRDRIISLFISDPLKKAEFYLLDANKRLNGAFYLFNKDKTKIELVQSTISKAENYFEQAILKTQEAKKQGIDTSDIQEEMSESLIKYQEILETISSKPSAFKSDFVSLENRVTVLDKLVKALSSS